MDGLTYLMIGTGIFAVFVNLILLYGNIFESHRKTQYGKMFSWILVTNTVATIADVASWIFEGDMKYLAILLISNMLSIVLAVVLITEFTLYISTFVGSRVVAKKGLTRAALIFYSVLIVATLVACFTGDMFTFENGIFVSKYLYDVYSIMTAAAMLVIIVIITIYRKYLGTHDSIAAYIYVAIPIIGAVINLLWEDYAFTYQLTTLAALVLYVMLHSEQSGKLLEENQVNAYYAEHDELTGLFSRRVYVDELEKLQNSDRKIGVVFCDLNGLKYVNDHFGHKEGDKMIKNFAELLKRHFWDAKICRISGDEFIIIEEKMNEEAFYNQEEKLEIATGEGEYQIACIGADFGPGKDANELIQNAETIMYKRKEVFHRNHPEMQR